MPLSGFHPIISAWFKSRFDQPTEPQQQGWPSIAAGDHTLISAPTGSGKTLAAFLSCIDRLLKQPECDEPDQDDDPQRSPTRIVYVSPLRALSNDMHRNLEVPLKEMCEQAEAAGIPIPNIRVGLRTGDTTPSQRAALVRKPPHILVTTPESLYLMLTAPKARLTLRHVETVIVDEIHALVRDKRGSHLSLTLERLQALTEKPLQRIGLSATQKPIERMAEFLVGIRPNSADTIQNSECGTRSAEQKKNSLRSEFPAPRSEFSNCHIVDVGHSRELDLQIEVSQSELGAVCTHEQWAEVYERLIELIEDHRSTLIFVNTRRMAERLTHQLTERLDEESVGSHHGSLSAAIRLKTERQLKSGELKAVVATASLELGIDVGYIDLVIQIGSPRSIATFLQRIGRSGHSLGLVPKGRLFALTRDELLESMALIRAVRSGRLDTIPIPQAPLDVLAQQIVAEVSTQEWGSDALFDLFRRAYPYRHLKREQFDRTVEFLSEGISRSTGRSRVYLHHDRVGRRLRPRKGSRIAAACNAGAIPEIGLFRVVAEPEHTVVGTVDEDFAIESLAGDVFLLGNTSWRIQHVRGGDVTVTDAQGAPPTIPFWRGEAPGRTMELSEAVSRLREELDLRIAEAGNSERGTRNDDSSLSAPHSALRAPSSAFNSTVQWLVTETCCSPYAAQQAVEYAAAQKAALGLLPTQRRIVFERFFDESGGMQMVIHAPFGSRITKAWGLVMRKRFCRSFDFELQATADDDGFILSLGPQHSFPLESMFPMLNEKNVQPLLEQAVLAVPMFGLRWRWNVTRALLVLRMQNGKKVPPAFKRFRADDLLTAVFPRITGCLEQHTGDIEIPDHPLVNQTMHDCLHEALDIDALKQILAKIERGDIELIARDTREPSPFSYELLNANPYAFLDGGELQERRARAVSGRRSLTVESVDDLGRLDPEAIRQVRLEAQPLIRSDDELHDALLSRIVLPAKEAAEYAELYDQLFQQHRVTTISLSNGFRAWVAAERIPAALAAFPSAKLQPAISVPEGVKQEWTSVDARISVIRGLIEISGPIITAEMASRTSFTPEQCTAALEALEGEGVVLRGHFTPENHPSWSDDQETPPPSARCQSAIRNPQSSIEWCHRRLLARIHRLTMQGLRAQIQPVGVEVYMRFLFRHHGLLPSERRAGPNGLFEVISMLQGIDVPVVCWERDLFPARIAGYQPGLLDELCLTGEVGWGRLFPPKRDPARSRPMASLTRVAPVSVFLRSDLAWLISRSPSVEINSLSSPAKQVYELIRQCGAMFASDLSVETQMLSSQLDDILGELVTRGLLTADGFGGLRGLIAEKSKAAHRHLRRSRRGLVRRRHANGGTGRWSLWRTSETEIEKGGRSSRRAEVVTKESRQRLWEDSGSLTVDAVEQWAWQLLRRWGVMFRDLLNRDPGAPSWFELLQVYRRLEARGEIRGGRFISGVAGEQFALGETVRKLRQLRDEDSKQELIFLSAADPCNLAGVLTDHPRTPATASNRIAYLNGIPVAAMQGGEMRILESVPDELKRMIHARLQLSSKPVSQHIATPV